MSSIQQNGDMCVCVCEGAGVAPGRVVEDVSVVSLLKAVGSEWGLSSDAFHSVLALSESVMGLMASWEIVELKLDKLSWGLRCACRVHPGSWEPPGGSARKRGLLLPPPRQAHLVVQAHEGACDLSEDCANLDKELVNLVDFGLRGGTSLLGFFGSHGRVSENLDLETAFCYRWLFPAAVAGRVVRILGPMPTSARLARYFLFVGYDVTLDLRPVVRRDVVHVERCVGERWTKANWLLFMLSLSGSDVRVGADEASSSGESRVVLWNESGAAVPWVETRAHVYGVGDVQDAEGFPMDVVFKIDMMRKLLAEIGVVLSKRADADLALVTYAQGCIPNVYLNKARLRMLALLGDREMKLVIVCWGLARNSAVGEIAGYEAKGQSNSALMASEWGRRFRSMLTIPAGVPSDSSKVVGTAVEALIGVTVLYGSCGDVKKVLSVGNLLQVPGGL